VKDARYRNRRSKGSLKIGGQSWRDRGQEGANIVGTAYERNGKSGKSGALRWKVVILAHKV